MLLQTWFGSQPWKSYGIQMVPLTPASELRDDPAWIEEMLPLFEESCMKDEGKNNENENEKEQITLYK